MVGYRHRAVCLHCSVLTEFSESKRPGVVVMLKAIHAMESRVATEIRINLDGTRG